MEIRVTLIHNYSSRQQTGVDILGVHGPGVNTDKKQRYACINVNNPYF